MGYQPQQSDYTILKQHTKETYFRMELTNLNYQTIDYFDSVIISGTLTISADSDVRRTLDINLFVKDDRLLVGEDSKIWFNRIVKCSMGYKNLRTNSIVYFPLGYFWFDENSYTYDISSKQLSVKCNDSYCLLNGTRNGQITDMEIDIPAGSNIRGAMISALTQYSIIKKYNICELGNMVSSAINIITNQVYNVVPYDLKFTGTTHVSDIITKLRDLYPGFETFFDIDNTFICQPLSTLQDIPLVLDADFIEKNNFVISENRTNKLSSIYNIIDILGMTIEPDYSSTVCTNSGSVYTVTFDGLTTYENDKIYAVKVNVNNNAGQTMKINNLTAYPIVDSEENTIGANKLDANVMYCFKFVDNKFYYLGQFQVHAVAMLVDKIPDLATQTYYQNRYNTKNISYRVNPNSPFTVDKIGQIPDFKSDNDYSKIYSDDLASQRALYELWLETNWLDTISLNIRNIPWLDVNQKIEYRSKIYKDTKQYIIKNLQMDLVADTCQAEIATWYPLYPKILN
ncbi:conserved protein of unknown function [Ruminococcaceae bacterium BL-6]|nr:conserved protein of unknown function [Ruminococcaceae bacterium BL-6]